PLKEIAPALVDATLRFEDKYYEKHLGVNPVSLLRATWNLAFSRGTHAGASTITMQLARLRYHLQTRTVAGKLRQIVYALELERHYSKGQILEAYLNLAPYGRNIEGVGAASEIYFSKSAARLTSAEAVALSVIPQSPTRRALIGGGENEQVTNAQQRWYSRSTTKEAPSLTFRAEARTRRRLTAPHFVDRILESRTAGPEIATALDPDQGKIHPLTLLKDAPHTFGDYNPENFDREFLGPIRACDALARSRNVPAVTLASDLSRPTFYEFLRNAEVALPKPASFYGLSLPLGGAEVTMEDLV